ncbi:MAG: threonine synthase, partial [Thermoanaerobaculia bacterium]|nr:threonine synthase [Thermoanaerobaculia bacterium]
MTQFAEWLQCVACERRFDILEVRYRCQCGGLLAVEREAGWGGLLSPAHFDSRLTSRRAIDRSGVWRFREAVLSCDESEIVTHPEGSTRLYESARLAEYAGIDSIRFKHEGENPTGSFKDRGMTVATTQAVRTGARAVACASTGNTSASLAAYASRAGLRAIVFVPAGKIAMGKLAQTLAYGATVLAVRGDFDDAMRLVDEASTKLGIYLLNSINPFRIEGQKTIGWEILQDLDWRAPDWIVLPAGNLGNTSAIGKAMIEALEGGWIDRLPRIASVQANGANPFYRGFSGGFRERFRMQAETVASAIRIGDPVSWDKARAVIDRTRGVVTEVTDEAILEAKAMIDGAGIGCEPASACSLAGARRLRADGVSGRDESVVASLTGNLLKDPESVLERVRRDGGAQMGEIDANVDEVAR